MQQFDISHCFKFYKCSCLKRILRQHLERKTICVVWTSVYFKKCMNRKRKRCNSPIGAVIVKRSPARSCRRFLHRLIDTS